ncbi:MAG: tetratricopeptide repeat protein [Lamprobacter sp.]|uniref:tetratricopeptide repeat protein n=1 Tax=Lamprobacter sp. TaxID=3100796 RepID=UPI002B257345|nr:tetratricopeptide repeat protein [Lamprobacter sp.]MEA3642343.1 tetratricopeptide repeat protein [Lamprobacter sp.]
MTLNLFGDGYAFDRQGIQRPCSRPQALTQAYTSRGISPCASLEGRRGIFEALVQIALDPERAILHSNLGGLLWMNDDAHVAIAAYQRAIALDPKLHLAHANLAKALAAQGQFQSAQDAYQDALRLKPYQPQVPERAACGLPESGMVYTKASKTSPPTTCCPSTA